ARGVDVAHSPAESPHMAKQEAARKEQRDAQAEMIAKLKRDDARIMDELLDWDGEEEERRLFYVAVTRAQDELYLTYPSVVMIRGGRMPARPSQFLRDLPDEHYEVHRIPGMHQRSNSSNQFAKHNRSW
ncbi:MAG: ATP-dependent helicase, partial [Opitutae bacterium]|nr:ATP-dependent helicase [Opitutae bacterium]